MIRGALIVLLALGMSAAHPSVRRAARDVRSRLILAVAEVDFRGGDRVEDFWTCCVAGLYGLLPPGERCTWVCSVKSWMGRHVPKTATLVLSLVD